MFWKKEDNSEKKLAQVNEVVKRSFANVKKDTSNIFQWISYLYKKNIDQEQMLRQQEQMFRQLQLELSYIPKTREDIRRIIDDYYSFESIISKIRQLDSKVEELAKMQSARAMPAAPPDTSYIEKRLEKLEQKKMSIKEKIMKRITRNSKEYVKSVMLSYIKKYERISALQLKEMIVDEQNFCSKSSFYRLLEEIEQSDDIGAIRQGKEKHYIYKPMLKSKSI